MTKDYILHSPSLGRDLHIDYAKELNPQQHEAVTSPAGASLVIAGAGSGKTRTLTYRVAWLVEHGVLPDNILLLTFTNKAAKEMLLRVQQLFSARVGQASSLSNSATNDGQAGSSPYLISRLWGGTFHSVGARVLRRHAKLLGYGSDFTILDRDDSKDLLDAILKESKVSTAKDKFPKANVLIEIFSLAVNTEKPLERILTEQYPYFLALAPALERFREVYAERKRKNNAMDFDDLLALWLKLLQEHAEVREFYAQKFQAILVDEYQDTNKIQADIVDALASAHRNVMAVGDDSQSIYSWRGANFQNIISFPERYGGAHAPSRAVSDASSETNSPNAEAMDGASIAAREARALPKCRIFKIESNYRSTPQILMTANAAIRPNPNQYPKELQAVRKAGAKPALIVCADGRQEAAFVAQRVIELQDEGVALNEIAVLYRAHFHSMELQMELTRRNMPFVINSGIRFFEQAHVKDVAAFLRLSVNPADELSFKRIAKMLPGVGPGTAEKLWGRISDVLGGSSSTATVRGAHAPSRAVSDAPSETFSPNAEAMDEASIAAREARALPKLGDGVDAVPPVSKILSMKSVADAVPAKATKDWKQFAHTMEQVAAENSTPQKIRIIVEAMYDEFLKENFEDYGNRRDDLQRLAEFASSFATLQEFLEQMALLTNTDTDVQNRDRNVAPTGRDSMWLSTVHQAKGLEWHTVFIIGLADEMFPSVRALEVRGGEEEERRLFYVAITRAKDELYLSFPMARGGRGGDFGMNRPSRFIKDIPTTLLQAWKIQISIPKLPQNNFRRPPRDEFDQEREDE